MKIMVKEYFIALFFLASFMITFSCGKDTDKALTGCLEGNCADGIGKYAYSTGIYQGRFVQGQPDGDGAYYFSNGDSYEGYSRGFKKEKQGIYRYSSGEKYVGEWKDDRREGFGVYYYTNGDKYEGQWSGDVKKGTGLYYYQNGSRYEGEFLDDRQHGKGSLYSADGSVKKGYWVYGEYSGIK